MLDDWTAEVSAALGLAPGTTGSAQPATDDTRLVLDLAREVAHGVARPAAPLTAYLVGIAVGRGLGPAEAAATVRELLLRRTPPAPQS